MVKLTLKIKMEVDNVTDIRPVDDFEFTMNVQCTSCREEHANAVSMNVSDERELSGSRGTANFVWTCPHCKKQHSASFIPSLSSNKSLILPYDPSAPSSTKDGFQPLLSLDCRGLEPTTFLLSNGRGGSWQAEASEEDGGKKEHFEFDLDEEARWDDYDEVNAREVGVREIESKWVRL